MFKKGIIFSVLAIVLAQAMAFSAAAEDKEEKKFPIVHKVPGEPFTATYENGSVMELRIKEEFLPLESTVTLADNSCTPKVGVKFGFVTPLVVRSLVAFWKVHPERQGQPILRYYNRNKKYETVNATTFISRLQSEVFERDLRRIEVKSPRKNNIKQIALNNPSAIGWLKCNPNCNNILPKNAPSILIWDENFEMSNSGLSMSEQDEDDPSFNQVTARRENTKIDIKENRIEFQNPENTYGVSAKFFPPGITYQVQWSFIAPNIVEADDELCQLKWDMDFGAIFTTFTEASSKIETPEKVVQQKLIPYIFREEDDQFLMLANVLSDNSDYSTKDYK